MKIQKGGVMKETRPEHIKCVIIFKSSRLQCFSLLKGKMPVGKANNCKTDLQEQLQ